jgi:hypothetical protein
MLLNRVTHPYEILSHLVDNFLSHQILRRLNSLTGLQQILLLLKDSEPGGIKFSPQTYSICMESNFVYSKTLIRID